MNESLLLAQFIGPVMIIGGLSMLANRQFYVDLGKRIHKSPVAVMFMSYIELILGIGIVLHHTTWATAPEVIVSIVGWGAILEAILLLFMTKNYEKLIVRFTKPAVLPYAAIAALILGVYMTWFGFFA